MEPVTTEDLRHGCLDSPHAETDDRHGYADPTGTRYTITYTVPSAHLVDRILPDVAVFADKPVPVLATGYLAAVVEWPAMSALAGFHGAEQCALGERVQVHHRRPVLEGMSLLSTARCVSADGPRSQWTVSVVESSGEMVALGEARFVIVHRAEYRERLMRAFRRFAV